MRNTALICAHCGSTSVRRSQKQSFDESLKMLLGIYPFRCIRCSNRFYASVWMLSKLAYAKCPKCLSTKLVNWPEKYFKNTFWRRFALTLGARRYRCMPCRYNFVSFRPCQISEDDTPAE